MAGSKAPTVPPPPRRRSGEMAAMPLPPRRREEDQPSPGAAEDSEPPSSTHSDSRELMLRKLRDVQEQLRADVKAAEDRAQNAIADLADVFERQIAERDTKIERQDDTIRRLQKADSDAFLDHQTLHEAVSAMGRRLSTELTASVSTEVNRQLQSRAAEAGESAGESAGKAAGGTAGKKWAGAGAFVGTVIATLVSAGVHQRCSATPEEKPLKPATAAPATGPGYGGRF